MQNDVSHRYGLASFAEAMRRARLAKGWSQRELAARSQLTQAQISRIENAEVDPQLSTLLELARSLDLDLQLVPRSAVSAVKATVRSAEARLQERNFRNLLADLRRLAAEACEAAPEREDIASIGSSLQKLEAFGPALADIVGTAELEDLRINLQGFITYPPAQRARHAKSYRDAAVWLNRLRNALAHAPHAERPAYRLDDED